MNVTYGPRKSEKKGQVISRICFFCFYYIFYLFFAVATKSTAMTEDSASFSKETIQFYREYTGVSNAHDLENHLVAIQQKLAKVCISSSGRIPRHTSMPLIEPAC